MFKIKAYWKRMTRRMYSVNLLKRLGYSKSTKLLIIHADDLGISGSENAASIAAMENGMVNSGSVMVTCPHFPEIADYSKTHPEADIGIHLTLTSEWISFKWKPVLASEHVTSIIDSNGFFFESKALIIKNALASEVEKEFRAQIFKALEAGIDLTHIDTHMYTAFSNDDILKKYIYMGKNLIFQCLLPINFL